MPPSGLYLNSDERIPGPPPPGSSHLTPGILSPPTKSGSNKTKRSPTVTGLLQPPAEPSKVGPCLCSPSSLPVLANTVSAYSTPHLDDFALDDIDSYMIAMETTVGSEGSRTLPSTSLSPGLQPPCSPGSHSEEEDDAEPSTVPGTPPPKKVGAGWRRRQGWGAEGAASRAHSASSVFSPVPLPVLWLHPGPCSLSPGPQPRAG